MDSLKNTSKIFHYMIIVISFFILMFFTKDQYALMEENKDAINTLAVDLDKKESELNDLNLWRAEMNSDQELIGQIEKFTSTVSDHELYKYMYNFIDGTRRDEHRITMKKISINKGTINEFGFNEARVNLSLIVSSEIAMTRLLDFVLNKDSKYNFYINSFSFPNDDRLGSYSVSLPLTILYK